MTIIEMTQAVIIGYATVWALYLLLFPLIASLWRPRGKTTQGIADARWPTMAIIIPARNAARVVAKCISSLRACHSPMERVDIYVVADHCSDDTAACARSAGATALIRKDGPAGKTYTLGWALDRLAERGITPDMYVVVDATARVEPNFLAALAECWRQGEHLITNQTVVASESQTWYVRGLALMFVHRNLQNWARERIGLSALLTGCGMAFSRTYIQQFGWHLALPAASRTFHPTEDWRHAVRAVEQGYRVALAQDARIITPLRNSLIEATKQGSRWERGRMANAGTYAFRLLMRGLWQRDLIKIFAALDAIQPPVAILAGLSVGVAAISVFIPSISFIRMASFAPVTFVALYGLGVTLKGRREGIGLTAIIWAPLYIAWRCATFVLAWGFLDRLHLGRPQRGVG